jgi:hypothetical protein
MARTGEDWRPDFEQAMGETFSEAIVPPVDFDSASAHECCEVIWSALGNKVTPRSLAQLRDEQIDVLSRRFGEYFECESPSVEKIREAIDRTLARWPVGSLDE